MRVLITGASGNVGRGMTARLCAAGHELVLHDLEPLPEGEPFAGLPFVQGDTQQGIGFDRAVAGCDLVLHTPAWHGIHWRRKSEIDYWRLNVDGTFWLFQAALHAGVTRMVFMSSLAWHGHYEKLAAPLPEGGESEGLVAIAHRANAFTSEQIEGWEADPLAVCERLFPGSRPLLEKYSLNITRLPAVVDLGDTPQTVGYQPRRHFGTFLKELARLDAEGGEAAVAAVRCLY